MGIFCGDNCKCRRSCREILGWNKAAQKACIKACNGGSPPGDASIWWEDLQGEIKLEYEGGQAEEMFLTQSQERTNYTPIFIVLGILIAALIGYLIVK